MTPLALNGLGAPPLPGSLEETGLSRAVVAGLILKTLYLHGAQSGRSLSDRVRLSFAILDEEILLLQQRQLVEVRGAHGHSREAYVFDLTGEGRTRARELLKSNGYAGPAPVPSETYRWWVADQSVRRHPISPDRLRDGLTHLVLGSEFIDRLGPGVNSGTSVFLYGPPGNGKTEVAHSVARVMGTPTYVPYAVDFGGQVVQIYDPLCHRVCVDQEDDHSEAGLLLDGAKHDPRFLRVHRPAVVVGGELTLADLEFQELSEPGVFLAPPQMKANGGIFVVDDFGRQRVRPRDLLNRWMIPLDRGVDHLALPTGHKLEVPFDCLVFFATNLDPEDLVEEAFLRRIRHKIPIPGPTRRQFGQILRTVCEERGLSYAEDAVDLVFREFYERYGISPRSCHPRDLVADICDHARYRGVPPSLSEDLLRRACRSYFVNMDSSLPDGSESDREVGENGHE